MTHCAYAATVNIPTARQTKIRRIPAPLESKCSSSVARTRELRHTRFGDRIARHKIRVYEGKTQKNKKKAARTVNCPCREASDATCTKNLAARAKSVNRD